METGGKEHLRGGKVEEISQASLASMTPERVRAVIRSGTWKGPTAGLARGYVQANLIVLPKNLALDFLVFCVRNAKACPVLDVTEAGDPHPKALAPTGDVRTDVPRYRVFRRGRLESDINDITHLWRDDLVAFLLGCSFSFEEALIAGGVRLRHLEAGINPPVFVTIIPTVRAGPFEGPLVVSMFPIASSQVAHTVQISGRYTKAHGAPIHIGNPELIGIRDVMKPDFGEPIEVKADEVPVFWACGVTSQVIASRANPDLLLAHAPGFMFIGDWRDEKLIES